MKRLWRAAVQSLPIKKPFLLKKRLHIVDDDASECLMRSVAEWCSLRMFATAHVYRSIFCGSEHVRPQLSCLVRSIAKRLVLAQSAGTPCVRFSLLQFDSKRGFLRDNRFLHLIPPQRGECVHQGIDLFTSTAVCLNVPYQQPIGK